ncbi:MAG: NADH-quinone oxidoreductase subunit C [Actinomycetota bacterium]|nr:NADH-quinone oxidoreductase subunit C [Actinomycetota bacterium]
MAEIPEHLLKRAQAAREKAAAQKKAEGEDSAQSEKAEPAEEPEVEVVLTDENAEAALAILETALQGKILDSHIAPGRGLWIRVAIEDWRSAAKAAKESLDCKFFDWLSAIDWMPSPYGREHETEQDKITAESEEHDEKEMEWGYTGGETRFQLICRVYSISRKIGVMIKADLPDSDPRALSLIPIYAGANWHEREAREMFGLTFDEHPDLRNIYLPGDFEGHPLRKDYPLLSRRMKPWPGIVDVELLPGDDE